MKRNWTERRGEAEVLASIKAGQVDFAQMRGAVLSYASATTGAESLQRERVMLKVLAPLLRDRGGRPTRNRKKVIRKRDGYLCVRCGALEVGGIEHSADHLFPREMGGCNQPWNLASLCTPCNNVKGRALHVWALLLMLDQAEGECG